MTPTARPSTILFDIDGTLVDSNFLHVDAWQRAFALQGVHADAWRIHRAIGQDASRLVTELAGERDEAWTAEAKQGHSLFYRELAPRLRAFDGATDLLRAVADRGMRAVLATSAPDEELELLLRALDAGDAVHATTSADDVDRAKPDPDILAVALERAETDAADAAFVGDSTWDMIAAERAGVIAYGVRSGGTSAAELREAGAREVFDDPADLLARLVELVLG